MKSNPIPELPLYRPEQETGPPPLSAELTWVVESVFIAVALLVFFLGNTPPWKPLINNLSINFLALMLEALPFMVIGSLAGGLIEVFVPEGLIERLFENRRKRAVLVAGAMGLVFPVCECAIIPVVRRLLGKGIPFSAAITFLLAGPIVNPIVAISTAVAYQYSWPHVLIRLGSGYLIAVVVGLVMNIFFNRQKGLLPQVERQNSKVSCGCGHEHGSHKYSLPIRLRHALEHAADDFLEVGKYLVIGGFLAAFTRTTVSMETFASLMESPLLAIILMMFLAIALNLCSEADAFISASFQGLLPGSSQMAFMVLGPMLDIKLIIMYFGLFKKQAITSLVLLVFSAVLATMLLLQYLFNGIL